MANGQYLGEIRAFGFGFAPVQWAMCNGQTLSIASNQALFALLGTTYGGNGVTTFQLPNLQGRAALHFGTSTTGASYGIGQNAGAETVTLTIAQMPAHTHVVTGTLNAVQTKATDQAPAAGSQFARSVDQNGTDNPRIYVPSGTTGTNVGLGGVNGTAGVTGGSQPHSIMQPYLVLNYCIATQGIFPSRN